MFFVCFLQVKIIIWWLRKSETGLFFNALVEYLVCIGHNTEYLKIISIAYLSEREGFIQGLSVVNRSKRYFLIPVHKIFHWCNSSYLILLTSFQNQTSLVVGWFCCCMAFQSAFEPWWIHGESCRNGDILITSHSTWIIMD